MLPGVKCGVGGVGGNWGAGAVALIYSCLLLFLMFTQLKPDRLGFGAPHPLAHMCPRGCFRGSSLGARCLGLSLEGETLFKVPHVGPRESLISIPLKDPDG